MQNEKFESDDFFGVECEWILLEKYVTDAIYENLWENFNAPEFVKDEKRIDEVKNQVIRKLGVEKHGLKNLLEDHQHLTVLVKQISTLILKNRYQLEQVSKDRKLDTFENNRFQAGLKTRISEIHKI